MILPDNRKPLNIVCAGTKPAAMPNIFDRRLREGGVDWLAVVQCLIKKQNKGITPR